MQVGSLGDIIFEVSAPFTMGGDGRVITPTEFSRTRKARFEQHNVLGALPRLEFLSADLATLDLPIRLRADMGVNPLQEADRMAKLCKEGKAMRLILCGCAFGMYVIESVSQRVRHGDSKGIFSVDVTLQLKEYV